MNWKSINRLNGLCPRKHRAYLVTSYSSIEILWFLPLNKDTSIRLQLCRYLSWFTWCYKLKINLQDSQTVLNTAFYPPQLQKNQMLCNELLPQRLLLFKEGAVTNLIGSLRGPDFPISAHGHGNASLTFCPFVYRAAFSRKPFMPKSFFQNSFLLDKKVGKQKLSFQDRFLLQY